MAVIVIASVINLQGCGDTGCDVTEYRITENGESKRCVEERCPGAVIYRRCY